MKRFAEQLKKKSERVKLRVAEKRDLNARLVSYMEYHPMSKSVANKNAKTNLKLESEQQFTFIRLNTPQVRGFFGAFVLSIFILIPVIAERAVPGDVLYPVKVNFNEEIRSTLAVSPYAKVKWETTRLERRIAEARLLASEGKLTDDIEVGVAAAMKQHSDAAQESIATLRESDSGEAALAEITFASALAVQSEVLDGALAKEVSDNAGEILTSGSSIAALAGALKETQQDALDNKSGDILSYEKLSGRIEGETTRAYELFESIKSIATTEKVADVERRLSDVERKIAQAADLHDIAQTEQVVKETASIQNTEIETTMEVTNDSTEVIESVDDNQILGVSLTVVLPEIELLSNTLSDLQKLISFMTDIDVRENVTVEDLVPVTLTDAERVNAIKENQTAIDNMINKFNIIMSDRVSDEKTDKIEAGIKESLDYASSSKNSLREGNLDGAELAVNEALAFLEDVETLIGKETPSPTVDENTSTSTDDIVDENTVDTENTESADKEETGTTIESVNESDNIVIDGTLIDTETSTTANTEI